MEDLGKILFDKIQEIRTQNDGKIEMSDIDGIIGSFMETMKGYVSSQSDITIYNEIEKLSKQIKEAKQEVVDLNPKNIADSFIPGATSELSAVTLATEQSTNIILDAAEAIQSLTNKMTEKELSQQICNKIVEIFEACNFQDITGQRINKVIKILEDIDTTINSLVNAFSTQKNKSTKIKQFTEKDLLNGPQLAAPSQGEIDDLFKSLNNGQ
jgi:chemotaxis protein CheZ